MNSLLRCLSRLFHNSCDNFSIFRFRGIGYSFLCCVSLFVVRSFHRSLPLYHSWRDIYRSWVSSITRSTLRFLCRRWLFFRNFLSFIRTVLLLLSGCIRLSSCLFGCRLLDWGSNRHRLWLNNRNLSDINSCLNYFLLGFHCLLCSVDSVLGCDDSILKLLNCRCVDDKLIFCLSNSS